MRLIFSFIDAIIPIDLDARRAPLTAAGLLSTLPQHIDLHSARETGQHIYWQSAILEAAESTIDLTTTLPGALVFWPRQQRLELTVGPCTGEGSEVIFLGQADASVEALEAVGKRVAGEIGNRILWADLSIEGDDGEAPKELPPPELDKLFAMRHAMWAGLPDEVAALAARGLARQGPSGHGLIGSAESAARALQDSIFPLWHTANDGDAAKAAREAVTLIESARAQLVDLGDLKETGELLDEASHLLMAHPKRTADILRELIFSIGRLAGWLDGRNPGNNP